VPPAFQPPPRVAATLKCAAAADDFKAAPRFTGSGFAVSPPPTPAPHAFRGRFLPDMPSLGNAPPFTPRAGGVCRFARACRQAPADFSGPTGKWQQFRRGRSSRASAARRFAVV